VSQLEKTLTDTTIMMQVKFPFYDPGAYAHVNEASALARQKNYETLDGERQAVADAKILFQSYQGTLAEIVQLEKRISALRHTVAGFRTEQLIGVRTVVDVLNTRGELTEATIAKINLEFNRDKEAFTLVAALARL
jgi:outer membrane protein TolC